MAVIIKNGISYDINTKDNIGINLKIVTNTPEFFEKDVYVTDGRKTFKGYFSKNGICIINGADLEGELTITTIVNEVEYEYDGEPIEVHLNQNIDFNVTNN